VALHDPQNGDLPPLEILASSQNVVSYEVGNPAFYGRTRFEVRGDASVEVRFQRDEHADSYSTELSPTELDQFRKLLRESELASMRPARTAGVPPDDVMAHITVTMGANRIEAEFWLSDRRRDPQGNGVASASATPALPHRSARERPADWPYGMRTITNSIASTLNGLIEACRDGQKGFRVAAENVRNEDSHLLLSDLSTQRHYFAGELKRLVLNLGGKVETNGSFSARLHRCWMGLKIALSSGNDRAILEECERCEDVAVAEYSEALENDDLPPNVRSVIQEQSKGVKAAHDRVRGLRDMLQD